MVKKTGSPLRIKKIERRMEEILQSAALAFREKGYYRTTMEDISEKLYMTKGSLYYYFKDKEQILYQCHKHSLGLVLEMLDQVNASGKTADEKLRMLIMNIVSVMIDALKGSAMAIEFNALSEDLLSEIVAMRDRYERGIRDIIKEGQKEGVFVRCDPKLTTFAILGAVNWITKWFSLEGPLTAREIGEQFAEMFLRSLSANGVESSGAKASYRQKRGRRPATIGAGGQQDGSDEGSTDYVPI